MNIQMVDLKGQYNKIKSEIDHAIQEVLVNSNFINGPEVTAFEQKLSKFTGVPHSIACANGTDALQIAMMALNLKPGDEVIVPAFTYIATAEAAALLGLKLVLCDSDPDTFNIDATKIENLISPSTKAIVPVHLFGQCSDMETISSIAKKYNLFVIEDNAQAIGAKYTFENGDIIPAGSIGDIGTTSFFPSKNLGCYGDGGAIFTKDKVLAQKIRMIGNHGQEQKHHHDLVGINSRLDTLQASILNVKINYLNSYIQARQQAAAVYDIALKNCSGIKTPLRYKKSTHVFHQYSILLNDVDRGTFREYLERNKIPSMIYYPFPIHFQGAYQHLGYKKGSFPVAEKLCQKVISLPMHTELEDDQLNYIIEKILRFFQ